MLRRPIEPKQYVSIRYTERLAEAGIEPSVGSIGDSYENVLAESINGLDKTEVFRRRGPWCSLETVEFATLDWVDWFNNRRLFEPIGNIPPAEAKARYYQWAGLDPLPGRSRCQNDWHAVVHADRRVRIGDDHRVRVPHLAGGRIVRVGP